MATQYPLVSGTNVPGGVAWRNRHTGSGTPTSTTPTAQDSIITVGGTPTEAIAASATVVTLAYTGTPVETDILRCGLNGVVYDYSVGAAESLQDALDGLVLEMAGDANWTTIRAGDNIEATAVVLGPLPSNDVAAFCLVTKVAAAFAGSPFGGEVLTALVEGQTWTYTVNAGDTLHQVVDGLVAACQAQSYWTSVRVNDMATFTAQYPNQSTDTVEVSIKVPLDVYGQPVSNLTVTMMSSVGDLAVTSSEVPGTPAIAASVYAVKDSNGVVYSYTYGAGDTDNDVAVALALAIGMDYTIPAPPAAAVIDVTGGVGVEYSFTDISTGGASCVFAVVCESSTAAPVSVTSDKFFRTTNQHSIQIICELTAGTSYIVTPWGYNAAGDVWVSDGTTTVTTTNKVITFDATNYDGVFIRLTTFVGGAYATVTLTGDNPNV